MRVLITGAAGRLGWHTVAHFHKAGHDVVATDVEYRADLAVKLRMADLLDRSAAYALAEGCDAVVHLGNHSNQYAVSPNQRLYTENVTMSMNLLQAALDTGVRNIVFASSIQASCSRRVARFPVEDETLPPSALSHLPFDTATPAAPGNHYALSKAATEEMFTTLFCKQYPDLASASIRYPALYAEEDIRHRRRLGSHGFPVFIDEAFAYLMMDEAAMLIDRILAAKLPGHRVITPSAPDNRLGLRAADLLKLFFKGVPLRSPIDPDARHVYNLAEIESLYGWTPKRVIPPFERPPEIAELLQRKLDEAWATP